MGLSFIHAEESGNILEVGKDSRETDETDKFIGLLIRRLENRSTIIME